MNPYTDTIGCKCIKHFHTTPNVPRTLDTLIKISMVSHFCKSDRKVSDLNRKLTLRREFKSKSNYRPSSVITLGIAIGILPTFLETKWRGVIKSSYDRVSMCLLKKNNNANENKHAFSKRKYEYTP